MGLSARVETSRTAGTAQTITAAGSHGRDATSPTMAIATDNTVATTAIVVALLVHTNAPVRPLIESPHGLKSP